ncbi:hypothetical protein DM860_009773 [Cuscuta australis]|uniref:Uncharacterized protein n=1 Tax=Cuscuta australis TaxID=267555 RepID=A0A328DFI7_9ASTE|nr:hypothetical protein DM860_009773 [Cuscuta australis]
MGEMGVGDSRSGHARPPVAGHLRHPGGGGGGARRRLCLPEGEGSAGEAELPNAGAARRSWVGDVAGGCAESRLRRRHGCRCAETRRFSDAGCRGWKRAGRGRRRGTR